MDYPESAVGALNWLTVAGNIMPAVLICTAFAITYVIGHARRYEVVARRPERAEPGEPRLPVVSRIAYGLVAVGGLIWADTLTMPIRFMAQVEAAAGDAPDTVHLWIQEIRQLAILLIGLGLLVALRRYRGAAPAAVLVTATLFVADLIIDRADMEGWPGLVFAAALAAALVLGADQTCRRAGPGTAAQANGAARFSAVAVVAGFCAPGSLLNVSSAPLGRIPLDLLAGSYGVGVALLGLAVCATLLARPAPVRPRVLLLAAVPVVGFGIVAAATRFLHDQPLWLTAGVFCGLPIAGYYLGLARWTVRKGARVVLARLGLAALLLVGAIPAFLTSWSVSVLVSPVLMVAAGFSYGADGAPYATGSVLVGTGIALLCSIRTRGPARRRMPSIARPEPA